VKRRSPSGSAERFFVQSGFRQKIDGVKGDPFRLSHLNGPVPIAAFGGPLRIRLDSKNRLPGKNCKPILHVAAF
jgi:hypothetical protein